MNKLFSSLMITSLLLLGSPFALAVSYTVTDLGLSWASGINNQGQVIGDTYTPTSGNTYHACLWSSGTIKDLGSLGEGFSEAHAINNSGQIVGMSNISGYYNTHAFLYRDGTMNDLGTLGGMYSGASGINNSGQIVGDSETANGDIHAFLYQDGTMLDLGPLGGKNSYASDINDSGDITGFSSTSDSCHPFIIYSDGTMIDLGSLPNARAYKINESRQIVGEYNTDGGCSAYLYSGGTMKNLGTLGGSYSYAFGINNGGQVVGESSISDNIVSHAFLYSDGNVLDLNDLIEPNSGWVLRKASDINDIGQIVGIGEYNGVARAILLTPVPEPSALLLMASGLMSFLFLARRQRNLC